MTSSKNPVREFIEILRRIRTGHENLKVSSGIPGFIPGTGERVDAFSTALPWESATPDGLFTLKGDKPENPEGLGFAIEIFPQTGVTSEMEKTLIGLAAPLEAGSVLSIGLRVVGRKGHCRADGSRSTCARRVSAAEPGSRRDHRHGHELGRRKPREGCGRAAHAPGSRVSEALASLAHGCRSDDEARRRGGP